MFFQKQISSRNYYHLYNLYVKCPIGSGVYDGSSKVLTDTDQQNTKCREDRIKVVQSYIQMLMLSNSIDLKTQISYDSGKAYACTVIKGEKYLTNIYIYIWPVKKLGINNNFMHSLDRNFEVWTWLLGPWFEWRLSVVFEIVIIIFLKCFLFKNTLK
jgi:hypothetical protein